MLVCAGTINPTLQDMSGKPKRSLTTIIHILNDLLGATAQPGARFSPAPDLPPHTPPTMPPPHHAKGLQTAGKSANTSCPQNTKPSNSHLISMGDCRFVFCWDILVFWYFQYFGGTFWYFCIFGILVGHFHLGFWSLPEVSFLDGLFTGNGSGVA
jgi:hypothetical protein